jgi:hypothetical protein
LADQYINAMAQTWNSGATTFAGIRLNVTDTASAAGSLLLDLQKDAVSVFSVRKDGLLTTTALTVTSTVTLPAQAVTRANLAHAAALSVLGNGTNATAAVADIAAASDHQVLRRSGTAVAFGAVALNQANAVSGALSPANGGTGVANNAAATLTRSGDHALTLTTTGSTSLMLPTSGTVNTTATTGLDVTGSQRTIADFNDTTAPSGEYRTDGTTANLPAELPHAFGTLTVFRYASDTLSQEWRASYGTGFPSGPAQMWRRVYTGGSWRDWQRMIHNRNLVQTVSQTAGVPTGGVFQGNASAASPTGGYAQRDASGFQTAHHVLNSSASADVTWTYNLAFLAGSTPAISIQPVGTGLRTELVSVSATAITFSVRDVSTGNRVAVSTHVIARGRWSDMT